MALSDPNSARGIERTILDPLCEQDFYLCVLHSWILTPQLFAFESEAFQIKDVYRSQYFGHAHSLWRYRALIVRNSRLVHARIAPIPQPIAGVGPGDERK
jgi:hypothetical protein